MKRLTILLSTAAMATATYAQNMVINMTNGEKRMIPVSQIDSITFMPEENIDERIDRWALHDKDGNRVWLASVGAMKYTYTDGILTSFRYDNGAPITVDDHGDVVILEEKEKEFSASYQLQMDGKLVTKITLDYRYDGEREDMATSSEYRITYDHGYISHVHGTTHDIITNTSGTTTTKDTSLDTDYVWEGGNLTSINSSAITTDDSGKGVKWGEHLTVTYSDVENPIMQMTNNISYIVSLSWCEMWDISEFLGNLGLFGKGTRHFAKHILYTPSEGSIWHWFESTYVLNEDGTVRTLADKQYGYTKK